MVIKLLTRVFRRISFFLFFLSLSLFITNSEAMSDLFVFCGAAFKRPMEDIIGLYEQKTGKAVYVNYGSLGTLLSQLLLTKVGDILIAPSPDIMERAKNKGVIVPETIRNFAFVVPVINVQKGNPKDIKGLKDLARPGIKLGLANPEIVYIGAVAAEILENGLTPQERISVKKNIVTYVEDFNKLASLLILKEVDAIIGFHFLEGWYPDKVSTVKLSPNEIIRIGCGQAGIITHTKNRKESALFIEFLLKDGIEILKRYHYFGTQEEAFQFVGAEKPVGGEFKEVKDWTRK